MKPYLKLLFIAIFLLCTLSASAEDFKSFKKRFYADKGFQISRIKFPLPGLNSEDQDIDDNKPYYWKKANWQMHHPVDKIAHVVRTVKNRDYITEEITSKQHPDLIVKSKFQHIKGKWYLVYYESII